MLMQNSESCRSAPFDRGASSLGYARIHRTLLDHPAFRNDAEAMAFAWLVLRASWRPVRVRYKERAIALERGQLAVSLRDFASAMDRERGWAERLIKRLKNAQMITTATSVGVLVITICNYAIYQALHDNGATPATTAPRHPHDTEQEGEEIKKGNPPLETAGGVAKRFIPNDWVVPAVADLPPNARACAEQWSAASYAAHGEAFVGYWRGRRARNADWRLTWANRVVAIHGMVMRDEKFGRAPPDAAAAAARQRPAMSAAARAAYLDRLAAQPWASAATPSSPASGARP